MKCQEDPAMRSFDEDFVFVSLGWIEVCRDSTGIFIDIDLGNGDKLKLASGMLGNVFKIRDRETGEVKYSK